MLVVGIAFLVYWLLIAVFTVEALHAALAVGIIFTLVGLLVGELHNPFKR